MMRPEKVSHMYKLSTCVLSYTCVDPKCGSKPFCHQVEKEEPGQVLYRLSKTKTNEFHKRRTTLPGIKTRRRNRGKEIT